jgi:hypothetical protein
MDAIAELKRKNEEIAARFKTVEERSRRRRAGFALRDMDRGHDLGLCHPVSLDFPHRPSRQRPPHRHPGASPLLADRLNVVGEDVLLGLLANGVTPVLVNEGLRPFFRLLPKKKYLVRSLAVAPLTDRTGRIAGSLNHGDSLPGRYDPRMDTTLLRSLAALVSVRLAEVGTS